MANSSWTAQDAANIRRALEIARDTENGLLDANVSAILQTAIGSVWRRIQAQPDTYIMTRVEFSVFNYYRSRFQGNNTAQRAVQRYWDSHHGQAHGNAV